VEIESAVISAVMSSEKNIVASCIIRGLHALLTVSIALSVFLTDTG